MNEHAVQLALQLVLERMRQVVREELALRATPPDPLNFCLSTTRRRWRRLEVDAGRSANRGLLDLRRAAHAPCCPTELEQLLLP